jgi:hypothetical protein
MGSFVNKTFRLLIWTFWSTNFHLAFWSFFPIFLVKMGGNNGYDLWKMLSYGCIWINIKMMHATKTDYETIYFEAHGFKVYFTTWMWVIKRNIINDNNAFLFMIWLDRLKGIHWEEQWADNDEPLLFIWIT